MLKGHIFSPIIFVDLKVEFYEGAPDQQYRLVQDGERSNV
jgi:hypothetical protein